MAESSGRAAQTSVGMASMIVECPLQVGRGHDPLLLSLVSTAVGIMVPFILIILA
jgi:hypothetical protein